MRNLILFIWILLAASCGNGSLSSELEMYQWLNNEANGLSKTTKVNGYKINVKYLPPSYLSYMDRKNGLVPTKTNKDSIGATRRSRTFLLTLSPDHENKAERDILFENTQSYEDYQARMHAMNFQMGEWVTLKEGGKVLKPSGSFMENIYSLGNQRSICFVFPEESTMTEDTKEELEFVFQDAFFGTGVTHFTFRRDAMNQLPEFNF